MAPGVVSARAAVVVSDTHDGRGMGRVFMRVFMVMLALVDSIHHCIILRKHVE